MSVWFDQLSLCLKRVASLTRLIYTENEQREMFVGQCLILESKEVL